MGVGGFRNQTCIFDPYLEIVMNFVAIDFETAHANYPCEIGLTLVEDGLVKMSRSWLIKPACFPYMNPWNQRVHGISNEELVSAPTFEELWTEIKPYLEDKIVVAHNAAFDMKVLKSALNYYDLAVPWIEYFCSVSLSRKVWKQLPGHSLGVVCQYHNIVFKHHRAGDDAKACAQIALLGLQSADARSVADGLGRLGMALKRL